MAQPNRPPPGNTVGAVTAEQAGRCERMTAAEFVAMQASGKTQSSESVAGRRGVVNPMVGTWLQGKRQIGGRTIRARSKAEANYARYLEWLRSRGDIQGWAHEPRTYWFNGIKRGTVSYLPDFEVIELSGEAVLHEVKGWMDPKSATKIKRMRIYHPTVMLIVIDSTEYQRLARQVRGVVPGWEQSE